MAIVLINETPTEVGCGADEIIRLREELAEQTAVIEQMREALKELNELLPVGTTIAALKLLPCPEVLNKVRADAVRKAFKLMMDGRWRGDALDVLADRMERGEA